MKTRRFAAILLLGCCWAVAATAAEPADGKLHWSFRPLVKPAVPNVRDASWPRNDIDRFVLAKLEAAGLAPNPDAERVVLIRRLALDLTGLPPAPGEVA